MSLRAAILLYRQAVAKDPGFALAYARLSLAEGMLVWVGGGGENVQQLVALARSDAETALKLAPEMAAAQLAIGYSEYRGRGDYPAALKAFAAALVLRPSDADALAAQGFVQRRQGRFDTAIASLEAAVAHDPRNSKLAFETGSTYMLVGRYAEAQSWFQRTLALDPDNLFAKFCNAKAILFSSGDIEGALVAAQGDAPALAVQRVFLLSYQRKYQDALSLLEGIADTPDNFSDDSGPKALLQANLYLYMGDKTRARPLFEQALSRIRARLELQQGIGLAIVWATVANAELSLGHTAVGIAAAAKSQAIVDSSADQVSGPELNLVVGSAYARVGRADLAVPLLANALATPGIGYSYSPVMLWIDPDLDPIHSDPRFEALLKQYAAARPAHVLPASDSATTP